MIRLLGVLCWLASLQRVRPQYSQSASIFRLPGRYLLGGLFDVHSSSSVVPDRPAAAECSRYPFGMSGYRKLQVMRFAVEEINNSTLLLPNVSLGYEVFDHCTDTQNFPGILNFISANGTVAIKGAENEYVPKVIGVIGPSGSKPTLTVAPLFSMSLLPLVGYDSTSTSLSENMKYPSFLRTNPSNRNTIQLIVHILKYFDWRWIAFLYSNDAYSKDGLEQFQRQISDSNICLPYIQQLDRKPDYQKIFGNIDELKINVVVVFALKLYAVNLVEAVVQLDFGNRVWVAGDDWSAHERLAKTSGINRIGTVIGVAAKVLEEVRKSNFTLVNRNVQFDDNGDPMTATYDILFWNKSGYVETVPLSLCSRECRPGFVRKYNGVHKCCFECEACPNGTFSNATADAETCLHCEDTEWSDPGSSVCSTRFVMFVPKDDPVAGLVMLSASSMLALTLATAGLFAYHYNTPVVKSAGGPTCFLCLACLTFSTGSVYFYIGVPTPVSCVLRALPFQLFITACLALFAVRAFQIVCIFKMAAKFPGLHRWWVAHNGQWLFIAVAFLSQVVVLLILYTSHPPKPFDDTHSYKDQTILRCDYGSSTLCAMLVPLVLAKLCFFFSYMGKDLPKNYNEAKIVTFSLLTLMISWITYATVASLYAGKYIEMVNAMVVLSSIYSVMLCYFLPKCYIIIFQPEKNTQKYFQGLIQSYTKNISK
ncbi:taste receptor type 1 member 2.2 [Aplochiton taeniatus]